MQLGDGCIKPLMSWKGHDLEAWCVAFDNWKVCWDLNQNLYSFQVYEQSNTNAFRACGHSEFPSVPTLDWCTGIVPILFQEGVLYSGADDSKLKGWDSRVGEDAVMWCNSKEHKAGVCCIAPNPFKEHVVVSGSYDEFARFWDVRNLSAPTMRAKVKITEA